jgi:hypothetical protein
MRIRFVSLRLLIAVCLVVFTGCGGVDSEVADNSGPRDSLVGCPRGASADYKEGWARAIENIYGSHDQLLSVRQRIDSGVLVEKHLENEMKAMREFSDQYLRRLRESADATDQEMFKGERDGYEYGLRRIIKPAY